MSRAKLSVAVVLLAASAFISWRLRGPVAPAGAAGALRIAQIPVRLAGWKGSDLPVSERQYALLESRDVLLREYRDGRELVLACVAVAGPESKAAHPPEICYRGQGWAIEAQTNWSVDLAGRSRPLAVFLDHELGERELVWSWYRVGDEETESWWREQWLAVKARVAGHDVPASLVRVSTAVGVEPASVCAAQTRLARFLGDFLPSVEAALAGTPQAGEAPAKNVNGR